MNENKFYVYAYLDPRKFCRLSYNDFSLLYEPFYIGKGNGNRDISHLSKYKLNKISNLSNRINEIKLNGFEPIIIRLYDNLLENIALKTEINLIFIIGRIIDKAGPLVNITKGGQGVSGLKHTIETRKKMSLKGDKHPNWNKHRSDETKKKISEKLKINNPMYSPELSEKVRLKNIGKIPWNKGISTSAEVCEKLS